jgi:hypothetical protein
VSLQVSGNMTWRKQGILEAVRTAVSMGADHHPAVGEPHE